jgi:hypothetical protein
MPACAQIVSNSLRGVWQRAKLDATRKDPSWNFRELPVGHDAMIIAPCETAALLDELMTSQSKGG